MKDDVISRQAAIDAIDVLKRNYPSSCFEDLCKAVDIAIKALSVQPEQRWIPCSERLPDDLEEVNVTWVNHIPEPYYDFLKDKSFTGSAVYYRGDWYWYSSRCTDILAEYGTNGMDKVDDGIEITAWMPLPEPYKEGTNNQITACPMCPDCPDNCPLGEDMRGDDHADD